MGKIDSKVGTRIRVSLWIASAILSPRNDDVKVDSRKNAKNVKKPARILGFLGIWGQSKTRGLRLPPNPQNLQNAYPRLNRLNLPQAPPASTLIHPLRPKRTPTSAPPSPIATAIAS